MKTERAKFFFFMIFACFLTKNLIAGGPIFVNEDGSVATWDNSSTIELDTEKGSCADVTYSTMATLIEEGLSYWFEIQEMSLSFNVNPAAVNVDIDIDNYTQYYVESESSTGFSDGLNIVIYDDMGEITQALFEDTLGADAYTQVLGFAGPDRYNDDGDTILDGQLFLNCRCYASNIAVHGSCVDNVGDSIVFTPDDRLFVLTHEIGHLLGLTHTVGDQTLAESDCDLTDSVSGGGGGDCDDVPMMFPISIDAADQVTPGRDDEVAMLNLYGTNGWDSDLCSVSGSLVDIRGEALRCADVQAVAEDPFYTVSAVSGRNAPQVDLNDDSYTDDDGECLSNCGNFTINGLTPNQTYTITIKPFDLSYVGGSTVLPCGSYQLEGVVEEVIAENFSCLSGEAKNLNNANTSTVATLSCSGLIQDTDSDGDGTDDCESRGGTIMTDENSQRTDLDGDGDDDCCISACGGTGVCSTSASSDGSTESGGGGSSGKSLARSGCSLNSHDLFQGYPFLIFVLTLGPLVLLRNAKFANSMLFSIKRK